MKTIDIAIIGGGASGMMAAITAAQTAPDAHIAILERAQRVGRKLLSTGNGRCNLTNMSADKGGYHGNESFALDIIRRFPPQDVLKAFRKMGLRTVVDDAGRVYPLCNQAAAVLDSLRLRLNDLGIEEVCDFDCTDLRKDGNLFHIISAGGVRLTARRVIVCAGGMAAPKIGGTDAGVRILSALQHSAVPRRPALTQIDTDAEPIRALKGLRYQGGVSLIVDGKRRRTEQGEILFAESGLSGIAVMQLSRMAGDALQQKRRVEIETHILPDKPESLCKELRARKISAPQREINDFLTGLVAKRIGQTLCKQAGIAPLTRTADSLSDAELVALSRIMTAWRIPVKEIKSFDSAQVTAGGADTKNFNVLTLESRIIKGLYAAGEVLDIDGDCGGFNLQWAWSSGMLAGKSAALSL